MDVEEKYRFFNLFELAESQSLEQFVHGAVRARQGHEHMRLFDQDFFPFSHIVHQSGLRKVFVDYFKTVMLKETRYDSVYVGS